MLQPVGPSSPTRPNAKVGPRNRAAYPVLLVAVGALLSWLPWVSVPKLLPEVVFYVFLPPLVYYAANFIAPDDLRANAGRSVCCRWAWC
jgi:hypothetical protein